MSETLGYIPKTEQSNIGEREKTNIGEELTELLTSLNENDTNEIAVQKILRLSTKLSLAKGAYNSGELTDTEYNDYVVQTTDQLNKYVNSHSTPDVKEAIVRGFSDTFPQIKNSVIL